MGGWCKIEYIDIVTTSFPYLFFPLSLDYIKYTQRSTPCKSQKPQPLTYLYLNQVRNTLMGNINRNGGGTYNSFNTYYVRCKRPKNKKNLLINVHFENDGVKSHK